MLHLLPSEIFRRDLVKKSIRYLFILFNKKSLSFYSYVKNNYYIKFFTNKRFHVEKKEKKIQVNLISLFEIHLKHRYLFYIGQCTSNGTCVCHCGNCTSGCDACLPGWSGSTINNCQKCSIILKMIQFTIY